MKFGLEEHIIDTLIKVLEANPKVDKALVFGSRAKGNYRKDSDIDIAIKGHHITLDDILQLSVAFEDKSIKHKIDLLDYTTIKEPALKEHIDRVGIEFYTRWIEVELRKISTDISYGYTASANDNNIGPKFLRITDITSGRINWETVPFCKITDKDLAKYKLGKGDIVIARTGATTGYNAIIKENINAVFASYLIRFQIDRKIADPFFIGYVLSSDNFQDYVDAIAGGSAQPGANAQQFADYKLLLPPLPEQTQIVNILSSLDDKIDLLHQQNKTLEQLAETLFKQWFVEEAKDDWEEKGLDEIADFLNGLACQKFPAQKNETGLPVIKIKEMRAGYISDDSDIATSNVEAKYIIENGDVLFSWSGSLEVVIWAGGKGVLNQHLFKVSSKEYPQWFYYFWTRYHLAEFKGVAEDKATTMGHIQRHHLSGAKVIVPSKKEIKEMSDKINPSFQKIKSNQLQINSLTQLRDTLLPKLMSGEVRVKMQN